MKRFIKLNLLLMFAFLSVFCLGACNIKKPDEGYVPLSQIEEEVIKLMDGSVVYSTYTVTGVFNYFQYDENEIPREFTRRNLPFVDSPDQYNFSCSSYMLKLPLHITYKNWTEPSITLTTKYNLEGRIYQPGGGYLDAVYYYLREDGGFIIRAFGVNKILEISKPASISSSAKWNITVEYDKDGYLISESFETLNAHKADDSETIYGSATYSYQ